MRWLKLAGSMGFIFRWSQRSTEGESSDFASCTVRYTYLWLDSSQTIQLHTTLTLFRDNSILRSERDASQKHSGRCFRVGLPPVESFIYVYNPGPKRLITATGAGPPSRSFVCPQYAITYFEGCHFTFGELASAGTRCSGTPVSVAHCTNKMMTN